MMIRLSGDGVSPQEHALHQVFGQLRWVLLPGLCSSQPQIAKIVTSVFSFLGGDTNITFPQTTLFVRLNMAQRTVCFLFLDPWQKRVTYLTLNGSQTTGQGVLPCELFL